MVIYVSPLSAVETVMREERPDRLISLLNPEEMIDTPEGLPREHHLQLGMNDISQPVAGLEPPEEHHVASLIDFVRAWNGEGSMLVHCWAGVSRSTAAAFISLCVLNEHSTEEELALYLRQHAPHASPNRLLVAFADGILGRDGRMVDALDAMGPSEMVWEGRIFRMPARLGSNAAC